MAMSTSDPAIGASLGHPPGAILLVGAGKMGGALLHGWIARGLDPAQVAVLEPQPGPDLDALTSRGLRLNLLPTTVGRITAIVLAIKPQVAPEAIPALVPFVA